MPSEKEDLPGTIERSAAKVQRTYEKTLDHYADARAAGIEGRSDMNKAELAEALQKHSERETRRAAS